jgi:hypothetical protein
MKTKKLLKMNQIFYCLRAQDKIHNCCSLLKVILLKEEEFNSIKN